MAIAAVKKKKTFQVSIDHLNHFNKECKMTKQIRGNDQNQELILKKKVAGMKKDTADKVKKQNAFGQKKLVRGEVTFFLQPGETLINGVQNVIVLSEDEALLLVAKENCKDAEGEHKAGSKWMVKGPTDYIPGIEVEVVERRKSIPKN